MSEVPKSQTPRGLGGRPKSPERMTTVCAWMEARHYDELVKLANKQDKSVSSLVKSLLIAHLK